MIVTEHGCTFAREGDTWRCVERPWLLMLHGNRYRIENDPHGRRGSSHR
jgi:hypothetical protein